MADKYEALTFASLPGVDMTPASPADIEAARVKLAEVAAATNKTYAAWPFDVSTIPAAIMACLDAMVLWRAAWLAWQDTPGGDGKGEYEVRRDALAAAYVADDDLSDLVDALISWREAQAPKYARAQARRQANIDAMAPKERPGIELPAKPSGRKRIAAKSRGDSVT